MRYSIVEPVYLSVHLTCHLNERYAPLVHLYQFCPSLSSFHRSHVKFRATQCSVRTYEVHIYCKHKTGHRIAFMKGSWQKFNLSISAGQCRRAESLFTFQSSAILRFISHESLFSAIQLRSIVHPTKSDSKIR